MDKIKQFEPLFGRWYAESLLGEGSFGRVYKIYRDELNTRFYSALKHISIPADKSEIKQRRMNGMDNASISTYYGEMVKDIQSEIRLMERLHGNTNIVSFEDSMIMPKDDGIGYDVFIRMELLTPLADRMVDAAFSTDDVVKLGVDICSALEICKEYGIIHRDIKPENIFISDTGNYKLGDFGIARSLEKTSTHMSMKGTPNYMAPEVYKNEKYGASCDTYSLGLVMYRLLNNNRLPFLPQPPKPVMPKDEPDALARRMKGEALPPPCNADEELSAIVLEACAYDPKNRFASAAEMKDALTRYSNGEHGIVPVAPVADFDRTHDDTDETQGVFGKSGDSKPDDVIDPNATSGVFSNSVKSAGKPETEDNYDKTHGAFAGAAIPIASETAKKPSAEETSTNLTIQPDNKSNKPTKKRSGWIIGIAAALTLAFGVMAVLGVFGKKQSTPTIVANADTPIPVSSDETAVPSTQVAVTAVPTAEAVTPTAANTAIPTDSSAAAPANWSDWMDSLPSDVNNQGYEIDERTLYSSRTLEKTTSTTSNTMSGWELYDTVSGNGDFGPWSDWSQTQPSSLSTREIETETRYRYRDKETTTSSQSSMSGWTYDHTTYSWSDYGAWSNWSTTPAYESDTRQVKTKTQYRYRNKNYTTSSSSSLSGWTQYDHQVSYGSWSSWQDTPVSSNNTTDVQTRTVYAYYYFQCPHCGAHMHGWGITCPTWAGGCGQAYIPESSWHLLWSTTPHNQVNFMDWHGTGKYYAYVDGELVFKWQDGMDRGEAVKTQYRYRSITHTYYYWQWGDWSSWSDSYVSGTSDRQVDTRTVYRYRDRYQIATYHYYRWGNWSSWSTTAVSETSTRQVESATFYHYRDRVTVMTYYFRRWSDWSSYSTTPVSKSDTVDVRTKTQYRYKPKS